MRRHAHGVHGWDRATRVEALETRALLSTVAWSAGPSLPAPRTDAVAVVTSDNAVRLLGGDAAAATAVPTLANGAASWTLGINIDSPRNDLGAVSTGSTVYLFGGTGNTEGSNEVLNYDYRLGDSQDLGKMNTSRYDLGYAIDASGRPYALGGIGVFADGEIWSDAECYSPASDTWTPIAALPQALHGLSAIGDGNGHIFVFGGATTLDDSGIERTSYKYDIATDTWSTIAPLTVGTRDSAVVMDDDGLIYVLGGMTTGGATDVVQTYDPATNAWSAETPLPEPLYSHAAAFGPGGKIIVAGGFNAAGIATDVVYQSQDLTIPDIAPAFSTTPKTTGSLDTFYTYDVNASGNPAPTYALITAPPGMSIDEETGLISWQPIDGQVGVHPVVVRASNRAGSVDQSFDITVVADTIAPTVPANFTFDSATQTSVTFGWDPSTDAVGVDHYDVATAAYVGPRFGKHWVYTVIDTVTTTTWTRTGLEPLSTEDYAVRAVDAAGNASSWTSRVFGTTLAAPDISFNYGTQTSGTIQSPALTPIAIQLHSTANPAATFSIVSGPALMELNPETGLAQWTPDVTDVGLHDVTFRASNSEGMADLTVTIDVLSDAPQLSVQFDPTAGGTALAGTLFTAQVVDHSNTPPTYSLIAAPAGLMLDGTTGAIEWTPTGDQGGPQTVTVRGTSAGGTTDLTFTINTLFTGAVTGAAVSGTGLLVPSLSWIAPGGEGSDLVASYQIHGFAEWGVGRTYTTHTVDYTVPATETRVLLTDLVVGKSYTVWVTPVDDAGHLGLRDAGTLVVSNPDLPQIQWTVNGYSGGSSLPGAVIAEQPAEIVLTDLQTQPSTIELIGGPAGLTFDASTQVANWTPTAQQVTTGYTTTDVTFRATNSVGSVDVTVPIRVFFSGAVTGASASRVDYNASASWNPPTDNATPIVAYSITRYWTFAGSHKASATWTVDGSTTSISFVLSPTGAVSHTGITITPVDEFGNLGVSTQRIAFGSYQNDLPPIAVDDVYETTEDTPLAVASLSGVLINDIDTDNTPASILQVLSAQLVSGPAHGALVLDSTGSISYTPEPNFNGTDSFVYRAYDGRYASADATVTIHVTPVNDAPTALDDYYFAFHDTPLPVDAAAGVLANDVDADGDSLNVSVVDNPANGSVTLNGDGSFSYTPNAGFVGIDAFTYVATDALLDSRVATVSIEVQPGAAVVGRHVFYNQSVFDGNSSGIDAGDDAAIAPDKSAFLPGGGASSFSNITSYSRGINGIMVDIAGASGVLTLDDFSFRMSTQTDVSNVPSTWDAAPLPVGFSVRPAAGLSGSDRVEIVWANGAIANRWLEVVVEGNDVTGANNTNTGLAASDVFYYGNRIGDAGSGTATLAITSALDEAAARSNTGTGATITNAFDFDRNGLVSAVDALIARNNSGTLAKINLANPVPAVVQAVPDGEVAIALALAAPQAMAEGPGGPLAPGDSTAVVPLATSAGKSAGEPSVMLRRERIEAVLASPATSDDLSDGFLSDDLLDDLIG